MEYLVLNNNNMAPACASYSRICYGPCVVCPPYTPPPPTCPGKGCDIRYVGPEL